MKTISSGVYPVMLTLYNADGSVDYGAIEALVEWYRNRGCHGIFATCLSSEIFQLSLEERTRLVRTVRKTLDRLQAADPTRPAISLVASGHISDRHEDQVKELLSAYEAGADSVVLITNRSDCEGQGDAMWIAETEALINHLPEDLSVGFYECPLPFLRPISPTMLQWMKESKRVSFIKDTSCDLDTIRKRLSIIGDSGIKLFNANAQTLLPSLQSGAAGFSGIMANFNPEIFVWLYDNYRTASDTAEMVQNYLCASAGIVERGHYPLNVKYLLGKRDGIPNAVLARSLGYEDYLTSYETMCADRAYDLNVFVRSLLNG